MSPEAIAAVNETNHQLSTMERLRALMDAHAILVESGRRQVDQLREQAQLMADIIAADDAIKAGEAANDRHWWHQRYAYLAKREQAIDALRAYMAANWVQRKEGGQLPLVRVTG
jgi:hypothetical protein